MNVQNNTSFTSFKNSGKGSGKCSLNTTKQLNVPSDINFLHGSAGGVSCSYFVNHSPPAPADALLGHCHLKTCKESMVLSKRPAPPKKEKGAGEGGAAHRTGRLYLTKGRKGSRGPSHSAVRQSQTGLGHWLDRWEASGPKGSDRHRTPTNLTVPTGSLSVNGPQAH